MQRDEHGQETRMVKRRMFLLVGRDQFAPWNGCFYQRCKVPNLITWPMILVDRGLLLQSQRAYLRIVFA